MKRKIAFGFISMLLLMAMIFALPVGAYKPGYDQLEDIRWYGGYNPDSGLSVLKDVSNGVLCTFKYNATNMWANRVVAGWDYNLTDTDTAKKGTIPSSEGIYVHLEDLKWDVPKATPANKEPMSSVMITISATQGGWSDGRALMFWIRKGESGNCILGTLRGTDANEKVNQFVTDPNYIELAHPITNEINFWFRRTSKTKWTLNINDNVIVFDDKTQVSERFTSMNPLGVSLGTWNSSSAISYVVSDLWSYNCIEYDAKNPPAFVKKVRAAGNKTTTTKKASGGTTTKASSKGTNAVGGTTDTTVAGQTEVSNDMNTPEDTTDTTVMTDANGETVTTQAMESTATTAANTKNTNSKGWLVWLLVGLIAVVLIGGGVAFWFLFLKKKPETAGTTESKQK